MCSHRTRTDRAAGITARTGTGTGASGTHLSRLLYSPTPVPVMWIAPTSCPTPCPTPWPAKPGGMVSERPAAAFGRRMDGIALDAVVTVVVWCWVPSMARCLCGPRSWNRSDANWQADFFFWQLSSMCTMSPPSVPSSSSTRRWLEAELSRIKTKVSRTAHVVAHTRTLPRTNSHTHGAERGQRAATSGTPARRGSCESYATHIRRD